jgi:hypothetical protein
LVFYVKTEYNQEACPVRVLSIPCSSMPGYQCVYVMAVQSLIRNPKLSASGEPLTAAQLQAIRGMKASGYSAGSSSSAAWNQWKK